MNNWKSIEGQGNLLNGYLGFDTLGIRVRRHCRVRQYRNNKSKNQLQVEA